MESAYQAIGIEPGGVLSVRDLRLLDWGRTLQLDCCYRLSSNDSQTFSIRFEDCREMKWRIYAFEDGRDEVAVVDLRLGRGGHRSPAHLLTDRFGLTLTYGELTVEHAT